MKNKEVIGDSRGTTKIYIGKLVSDINSLTPSKGTKMVLNYNEVYSQGKAVSAIISNFSLARSKAKQTYWEKIGMISLFEVLQKTDYDDLHRAQLSILIHVSKWLDEKKRTPYFVKDISVMKLTDDSELLRECINYGRMAINHVQVIE